MFADISINEQWLAIPGLLIGVALLIYAIWPLTTAKQVSLGCGILSILVAFAMWWFGDAPSPSPSPRPGPAPAPDIAPADLQAAIAKNWTGTKAQAQVLAAAHEQMGRVIQFDGTLAKPVITSADLVGGSFASLQRNLGLAEKPWGDQMATFEATCAAEATRRGLRSQTFNRDGWAQLYLDIGAALAEIGR